MEYNSVLKTGSLIDLIKVPSHSFIGQTTESMVEPHALTRDSVV